MAQTLIELKDVALGYNNKPVISHVSTKINQGTWIAMLGPNGSGKSTLFKGILGLISPIRGEILLTPAGGAGRSLFGYVPQRENLDPIFPVTAFEVAMMGLYGQLKAGQGITRVRKEWVAKCLKETGALELRNQLFSQLSGGQKQRVLLARAIATRPEILILDEPTSGIDVAAEKAIYETLKRLNEQEGVTIVMVTHHLTGLKGMVKEVIWLNNGRVTQGTAEEMLTPEKIQENFVEQTF